MFLAGVAAASGECWEQLRKFTLNTFRIFGVGRRSFEEQVSTEAKALVNEFHLRKATSFNPQHVLTNTTSNVICSVIFGKRYEYSDEKFHRLLNLINEFAKIFGPSGIIFFIPFANYLLPKSYKTLSKNFTDITEFINKIIDDHRANHDPNDTKDFIDACLNELAQDDTIRSPHLNSATFLMTLINLFGAGTETTSTTLRWSLLYMMKYPDIQQKIQQEIDSVVGRDRFPKLSDAPQLPYTEAVLLEVQRIASVAPLGVIHSAANAATIKGFYIPKGSFIVPHLQAVHHDDQIWENPSEFKPSRFLEQSGKVKQYEELIPFSTGTY